FILSPTRSDAPSSGTPLLLPISASTLSSPLQLPSASRREDRPEVTLPPRNKLGQMTEIRELHAADRRRQIVISELLRADHRRSTDIIELRTALQGQVTVLQGQKQMAPKRTTRSTADRETINATSVTNAQLQAMIDQG
nr:hypothetical protein [Tanacetum cinerariifolium]